MKPVMGKKTLVEGPMRAERNKAMVVTRVICLRQILISLFASLLIRRWPLRNILAILIPKEACT